MQFKIIIALLLIMLLSASYKVGTITEHNQMIEEQHKQEQIAKIKNDKIAVDFIQKTKIIEVKNNELQIELSKVNNSLDKCAINRDILRKFKQATMSSSSDLPNPHDREFADNQGGTGLDNFTAEDLSENYLLVVNKYKSCAVQYNSLLKVLGY